MLRLCTGLQLVLQQGLQVSMTSALEPWLLGPALSAVICLPIYVCVHVCSLPGQLCYGTETCVVMPTSCHVSCAASSPPPALQAG
jgi:hypothetical protein